MSMISEQVKGLRIAAVYKEHSLKMLLEKSADTIESLSAKLETANKELERWHTDKINDKIKNPFAWTSTLCCHNCDHKDEYIEELEAANMELSAEDCGRWIPCKERSPDESLDSVIGWDKYRRRCCFVQYMGGRWILGNDTDSVKITAWQPMPEDYHG